MTRIKSLLLLLSTLLSPALLAQSDNCLALIQQNNSVSIPIGIAGGQSVAVLNTGTLPVGISNTLASNLGLAVEAVPASNIIWSTIPTITGQINQVPISVFGQEFPIEQMYVIDNPQPFVYLSLLLFQDLIMQIDFPQSKLCFLPQQAMNLKDAANIELRSAMGRPIIEVTLNGDQKVWLELQLEHAGAIQLKKESAEKLGFSTAEANGAAFLSANLDVLSFGPYELGNIAVSYATQATPPNPFAQAAARAGARSARARRANIESDGIIGREILQHFVITLDVKEELLHAWVP